MTVKTKARTFESAYRSLEALVSDIETRELGLEEGIAKFEQGLELAQFCKSRLAEAENKVTMIKQKFGSVLAPDDEDGQGRVDMDGENLDLSEPGDDEEGVADVEDDA